LTDAGASISRWPTELPAWPHARGAPPDARGIIRSTPEDFFVEEQLAVDFSGDGEHVWLHIEKTGVTTLQVCERIADCFQARPRDVGFSGLKDRWAVTRQWFSVPLAVQQDPAPLADTLALPELRVLNCRRHFRKLRRGTHRANRFELVVREVQGDCAAVDADLARILADNSTVVELEMPKADITLDDGTWLVLTAQNGVFTQLEKTLTLEGAVNLFHDSGYELQTSKANVDLEKGLAKGDSAIRGQGPFGELHGDGFRLIDKGKTIVFTGKSKLVIYPGIREAKQ